MLPNTEQFEETSQLPIDGAILPELPEPTLVGVPDEAGEAPAPRPVTRGLRRAYHRLGTSQTGFSYVDDQGQPVADPVALERIGRLRIPPAWTDVRISRQPGARIQATGFDSKSRKQYIYSPRHVERRAQRKQSKLEAFAAALPRMRAITAQHLAGEGLGKQRVLAAMVRLIDEVAFRVGNERYTRESRTFGISTLEKRHVKLTEDGLVFSYLGKHGIRQCHIVTDDAIREVVAGLLQLRGRRLFKYLDDELKILPITSRLLNRYIQELMGSEISAKDFRTWIGTVQCALQLAEHGPEEKEARQRRAIVAACRAVADRLGNTASIARSSYVDARVLDLYRQGKTIERQLSSARRMVHSRNLAYEPEELAVMRLLGFRVVGVAPTTELEGAVEIARPA